VVRVLQYALAAAQLCNAIFATQAIQHNPDLLFAGLMLARGSLDIFDDLLARLFVDFLIVHSAVVTMSYKPSLSKSPYLNP